MKDRIGFEPVPPRLSPFEQAAEECSRIFDGLTSDDKRALAVRLVALGALNEGDLGYIEQVAEQARDTVREFLANAAAPTGDQKQRDKYLSLRREFEPESVTLVVVAKSPPVSGNYFYNPNGEVSEQLFKALMEQLGIKPKTKLEGLREFQKRGWVLIDATYQPVNAYDSRSRDLVIDGDYPKLSGDLKRLLSDRWTEVPLILIKANVRKVLEPKLKEDGFKVLNKGRSVYFPGSGRQRDFDKQFREIVRDL